MYVGKGKKNGKTFKHTAFRSFAERIICPEACLFLIVVNWSSN